MLPLIEFIIIPHPDYFDVVCVERGNVVGVEQFDATESEMHETFDDERDANVTWRGTVH